MSIQKQKVIVQETNPKKAGEPKQKIPIHWREKAPIDLINFRTFGSITKGLLTLTIFAFIQPFINRFLGFQCVYDWLPHISRLPLTYTNWWRLTYLFPIASLGTFFSWYFKKQYLKGQVSRAFLNKVSLITLFVLPFQLFLLRPKIFNVWAGLFLALFVMSVSFKSFSYIQVLFEHLDKSKNETEKEKVRDQHRTHGSIKEFCEYLVRPWLIYELDPPRTEKRNYFEILKLVAMIFLAQTVIGISVSVGFQVIYKTESPWKNLVPNLMCLGVPSFMLWASAFVQFFHGVLTLCAEITRYGPRGFYSDWWNKNTLKMFWRDWNRPVNFFAIKYIYLPCKRVGVSSNLSGIIVFVISGLLHEYLLWGMFGNWNYWVFIIFVGQPITMMIEKKLSARQIKIMGELLKILTFFGGLAFIEIFYIRKYLKFHPEHLP
ncbi:sterol o-acyltransferase [Anaeramoeba flamelloides]|uniref:Sterol o-acyltransferase n=1 Tax=Anaeramoeba flamelloides TaxID=1746091 RepID=A0ABQ8YDS5_9EUKA|nr:sterol o-acyltransferase [Anaeramoeba flamelloides]